MQNKSSINHNALDSDYDSQTSYIDNEDESIEHLSNSSNFDDFQPKQKHLLHLQNSNKKKSIQHIVHDSYTHNLRKYSLEQQNFEATNTKSKDNFTNNENRINKEIISKNVLNDHNSNSSHSNFEIHNKGANNKIPYNSNNIKVSINISIQSQMKRHKKDFLISEQIQVNRLPRTIYYIKKKVCSVIGGKKINFVLLSNDNIIIDHTIDLKQKSTQFKTNQLYFINFSDEMNIFSMQQNDSLGNKYITIKYCIDKIPIKHKLCQIIFHTSIPGISSQLLNLTPSVNSKGKAFLPFGKRKLIPSSKNMIFVDREGAHKSEIIAILKISKSTISIEAVSTIPEEMIFMIGVSSFLNHSS